MISGHFHQHTTASYFWTRNRWSSPILRSLRTCEQVSRIFRFYTPTDFQKWLIIWWFFALCPIPRNVHGLLNYNIEFKRIVIFMFKNRIYSEHFRSKIVKNLNFSYFAGLSSPSKLMEIIRTRTCRILQILATESTWLGHDSKNLVAQNNEIILSMASYSWQKMSSLSIHSLSLIHISEPTRPY